VTIQFSFAAEQLKRQDQALKTKRMLQLGGGLVTGAFAFIGLMRMPMPILSKMSLTALASPSFSLLSCILTRSYTPTLTQSFDFFISLPVD